MKNQKQIIETLKTSPIVQIACQKAGISRATYYRWRKLDENFKKQTRKSIKEGCRFINDLAESQLISAIKDKNMTAIIFWLKNHHRDYTDKLQINPSKPRLDEKLTPEDQKIIEYALKASKFKNLKKEQHDPTK